MPLTLESFTPPQTGTLDINVRIQAEVKISPKRARQLVGIYVGDRIGNLLHGDTPTDMVVVNTVVYWRVPILRSHGANGKSDVIGSIDVDVETGELRLTETLITELKENARRVAPSSPSISI